MRWFQRRKSKAPTPPAPLTAERAHLIRITERLVAVLDDTERQLEVTLAKLRTPSTGVKP